jgi:hypothetical protein
MGQEFDTGFKYITNLVEKGKWIPLEDMIGLIIYQLMEQGDVSNQVLFDNASGIADLLIEMNILEVNADEQEVTTRLNQDFYY